MDENRINIDVKELCKALGIEYDPAKSSEFYLMIVKQYRIYYEAAVARSVGKIGA